MGVIINCETEEETTVPDRYGVHPVPRAITRYQFIQAVEATGRMNDLLTYIDGLSGIARQYWLNAQELNRDDQELEDARVALNVSQGAIDTVFRNALQYKR